MAAILQSVHDVRAGIKVISDGSIMEEIVLSYFYSYKCACCMLFNFMMARWL